MLKSAVAALALLAAGPALAAPPAATPASAPKVPALLTVDTPLRDLIARARSVIGRDMSGFVERLESEPEVAQIFGGVSRTDMMSDPHATGLRPEVLAKIDA
jgi:hypothetical protein